ncbi:MAG: hypothetical protein IJP10_03975 [Clostridia bacterium]|nr:hypothetical protein [Clostridia bacterium]
MIKKLKLSTFEGALRVGGFIGWYFTVMYICEHSLHYYQDHSLLLSVNQTFLTSCIITLAVLVALLSAFDIEGILSNKLLRWLPGIFMAESGIALSLATFATMTVFSSIAGVAFAFGAVAIISCLLKVKVGQRLFSVALGLAIGGVIRIIASLLLSSAGHVLTIVVAVIVGLIAAVTVHSDGYSRQSATLVSLAEANFSTLAKNIPAGYISIFFCVAAFYFSHTHVEAAISTRLPHTYEIYEYVSFAGFIIAAAAISVLFKFQHMPLIFAYGTALTAAASCLIGLPNITASETTVFALLFFMGLACFKTAILLYIIVFSLDRPHPLFYATFGYAVTTLAELVGSALSSRISIDSTAYPVILLILSPIGGWLIHRSMKKAGFTDKKLEHRRILRDQIRQKCAQLEMSEREETMIENIVLEKCDIEDLSQRMLFSKNTVKVLLRAPYEKLGLSDEGEVRSYFEELADQVELDAEKEREKIAAERKALRDEERRLRNEERDRHEEELRRRFLEKHAAAQAEADEKENSEISQDITIFGEDEAPAAEPEEVTEEVSETEEEVISEPVEDEPETSPDSSETPPQETEEDVSSDDSEEK